MVKSIKQQNKEEARYQKDIAIIRAHQNDKRKEVERANKELDKMRDAWIKRRMRDVMSYVFDGVSCVERSFYERKKIKPNLTMKEYKEEIKQAYLDKWQTSHEHKRQVYNSDDSDSDSDSDSE